MASDLLSFPEEEELEYEEAIVQVVQPNDKRTDRTELSNLSFMRPRQKFSGILETMFTRSRSRVLAGFLPPNRQENRISSLRSISFFRTVLLVSCWLEIDRECTKFSPQSSKVMGSRQRKTNSRYEDGGKKLSLYITLLALRVGKRPEQLCVQFRELAAFKAA